MKTPEEIKKGLECCENDSGSCSERCPYFNSLSNGVDCASKMHADALAYIQQLEKMLGESFARNAPALEAAYGLAEKVRQLEAQVPRWISVEERLPICGERVLITDGACVFEAYLSISHKWVRSGLLWQENVTHWMPLPSAEV